MFLSRFFRLNSVKKIRWGRILWLDLLKLFQIAFKRFNSFYLVKIYPVNSFNPQNTLSIGEIFRHLISTKFWTAKPVLSQQVSQNTAAAFVLCPLRIKDNC
jgi:hypothetical protein